MSAVQSTSPCPFQSAETTDRRVKIFLWGDSGVGKTTLALQFPSPAVIDLEGGTNLYGDAFDFAVLRVTDADEITGAMDWLHTNLHPYRTLVIDPVTMYWDALQKKWSDIFLRRNKGQKGHRFEYYDLGPRDWMTIKSEFKDFIRKLIRLDMNVIVTARQKVQYADSGFMRVVGETFDGEKSLPYMFDTIIHMRRDEKGRFLGTCLKDRSNKLPAEEFEISYAVLEAHLGRETLVREAQPVLLATADQVTTLRHLIAASGMNEKTLARRLTAYGADSLETLTTANAAVIIEKLETAVSGDDGTSDKEFDHAED